MNDFRSFYWMSGALLSFCLMAVGARELSGHVPIFQTQFFRSAVGLTCILLIFWIRSKKASPSVRTERFRFHMLRNVFHFAGQYCWFFGLGLLPLAEVFALEFTVPIWTIIVAAIFLGEKVAIRKVVAILLGLLGVVIIVKPGYAIVDTASLVVLGAAILFAICYSITKSLSSTDEPLTILFYMCLLQLPMGFALSISNWEWPIAMEWCWLVLIGLTALSAHYCMTRAMQFADITTIVTLDFLRLPLIALVGVLVYEEQFEISLIVGGLIMLLANVVKNYSPRDPHASVIDG